MVTLSVTSSIHVLRRNNWTSFRQIDSRFPQHCGFKLVSLRISPASVTHTTLGASWRMSQDWRRIQVDLVRCNIESDPIEQTAQAVTSGMLLWYMELLTLCSPSSAPWLDLTLPVTDPVTHKALFDLTHEEIFPTHPLVDFRIRQTFVSFSLWLYYRERLCHLSNIMSTPTCSAP